MSNQDSSDDLLFRHCSPEFSDDETDSDTNDSNSESFTGGVFRAGAGPDFSIVINSDEHNNDSITGYKKTRTLYLSAMLSLSALPDCAVTHSPKRALASSHLHPESPCKRVAYSGSSNMFLGRGSLGRQENDCLSVVMGCAKHSSEQELNIWQEHCSNPECTQRDEPVWCYEQLAGYRVENGREYVLVKWHAFWELAESFPSAEVETIRHRRGPRKRGRPKKPS
ncbi:hypothetical protein BDBG_00880 [Blastomyces gilchristii SLH14081]|uniref:Chromo domain-containing protein n=1 Tax=Blastomyces gilchristii (strain SLH14081) TaxID=559298 RepID=A0A179U979_BLAGS|nr:uncharacterized protein BDBG_00880 [Blastomyces gilchristii SLH14081]OAT04293.1 hypothetical protein BDBG_00880 [Blastomyces gilchristii SLH14081]